jgi:serine/threonine protein kinase
MGHALSSLPAERWAEFSRLLDQLLDLEPPARAAWLAGLGSGQADLAELLAEAAGISAAYAAQPPAAQPRLAAADQAELWNFKADRLIGPYRLIEPLGQGGMGEVWSARRHDGSVNREVALKLPHTWLLTAGARMRLGRERDFLAGLSHPNIAQLHDAGIDEDGQPWMALEKVAGQPIDHWCNERRLPVAARIALFLQVLDAVSAAHARLIVHRDLKPTNILVSDDGRVKLLDFGIAKLIDEGGRGQHTEITRIAGRSATPEYAAPEHLAGDTVTVATDIYSLGVVLHELLTGRRPPPQRRRRRGDGADNDPPLASTAVATDFPGQLGGLDERGCRRALLGDLDAILARALASLPEQRYASAERMADDLRRHLASEPIAARHITRLESAWKFARRHRLALASALLVSVSVIAGVSVSVWQAQRAMVEATRANSTRDFLIKVLAANGRLTAGDRPAGTITAREMMDRIIDELDDNLGAQPETQLELLSLATQLYRQWYDQKRLESSHERYRALLARVHGPGDRRIVESLIEQASSYNEYSDYRSGLPLLDEAEIAIHRHDLAGTLIEAELLTTRAKYEMGDLGNTGMAIERLQRAVAIYSARGPEDRKAHWARFYLARALAADGQHDAARRLALDSIAIERRQAGRSDWFIAWQTVELGHYERAVGRAAEAAAAYAEGERMVLATFGRDVDTHLEAMAWRATMQAWAGNPDAALAAFADEQALLDASAAESGQRSLGEGVAWFSLCYGRLLLDLGRPAEALPLLTRASAIPIDSRPVQFRQADAMLAHAEALAMTGSTAAATAQFNAAHAAFEAIGQPSMGTALLVRVRRARHLASIGERVQAAAEYAAVLRHAGSQALPAVAEAEMGLAELAALDGHPVDARRQAEQALRALDQVVAAHSPWLRRALLARQAELKAAASR